MRSEGFARARPCTGFDPGSAALSPSRLPLMSHKCYFRGVTEIIGLRELRQHASDVVRRVEDGESVTVTVNGRPAAQLVPIAGRRWRSWDQVANLLGGPGAPDLAEDLAQWDDQPRDPFAPRAS